ncbi:MAG: glycosyltransferase [Lachnospiraceae bacterium]|nr:glycosyltransferase [Lachnospiraceae bacterium]
MISFIIPVFNVERYLERCLKSILNQSYKDYEIILVDDGSTDNSKFICDKYEKDNSNVRVIHKTNEGLGMTRNRGIEESSGEYLMFVDSDDYIVEDAVSNVIDYVSRNDLDVCFFGRVQNFKGYQQEYLETMPKNVPSYKELTSLCLGEPLKKDKFEIGPAWKAVYRKEFLVKNDLKFESERMILSEDYIFSSKLCISRPRAGFLNIPVYCYCDNSGSLTNSYNPKRYYLAMELYKRMTDMVKEYGLGEEAKFRAYNNYLINLLTSFKHIVKANTIGRHQKIIEIRNICTNRDIRESVIDYSNVDTIKLRILRRLILLRCNYLIYCMVMARYGR